MKQLIIISTALLICLGCSIDGNFNQQSFYNLKIDETNALCKGSGLGFGKCIADKIKEGRCIGVSQYRDTHIAIEIPYNTIFPDSLQQVEDIML